MTPEREEDPMTDYQSSYHKSGKTAIQLDAARESAEDIRQTLLICILSGRARLRELGDRVGDEGPVDNLAVAAHLAWDLLTEPERGAWSPEHAEPAGSPELIRELHHALDTWQ
jgi:hypothetical protein